MSESEIAPPQTATASNERFLAALAHGSVILSFLGPIVPALVWVLQRRKSPRVSFHALQAMTYQALLLWVGLTIVLVGLLALVFGDLPTAPQNGVSINSLLESPLMQKVALFQNILYGAWGLLCLPGIVGAVACLFGADFRYPLLGARLEKVRAGESTPGVGRSEEDWVAGICHSSAIVMPWGAIVPLLVWTSERDRPSRLRFQSLQAALYQLLGCAYFVSAFFLATGMAIAMLAALLRLNSAPEISSNAAIAILVGALVMLLILCVVLLSLPMFHLFAMLAWIRTAGGEEYLYPALGKFLARRMARS